MYFDITHSVIPIKKQHWPLFISPELQKSSERAMIITRQKKSSYYINSIDLVRHRSRRCCGARMPSWCPSSDGVVPESMLSPHMGEMHLYRISHHRGPLEYNQDWLPVDPSSKEECCCASDERWNQMTPGYHPRCRHPQKIRYPRISAYPRHHPLLPLAQWLLD